MVRYVSLYSVHIFEMYCVQTKLPASGFYRQHTFQKDVLIGTLLFLGKSNPGKYINCR